MIISRSLNYCWNALKKVSRSFAITIPIVEKEISIPIMVGYLEARILDNFEDEGKFVSTVERLKNIDKAIHIIVNAESKHIRHHIRELKDIAKQTITNTHYLDLVLNMDKVIAVHNTMTEVAKKALCRWLSEMAYGMKKFVGREINTFAELNEYCYYVAGTVGGFLTELIINTAKEITVEQIEILNQTKTDFGLFLQKVNIIRDIRADIKRNERIFWPRYLFRKYDVKLEHILDRKNEKKAMSVLDEMIENAKNHISPAKAYINAVPQEFNGYKKASAINLAMGIETLKKVKNNPDVFYCDIPVKIDKKTKEKILTDPIGFINNS